MPRANPETMTRPACARPRDSCSVKASPAPEALRETHDGHGRARENRRRAAHGDERRRRIDLAQQRGIIRFAERDEPRPAGFRKRELSLDLFFAGDPDRLVGRQPRQRFERRASAAEPIDQRAESTRPVRCATAAANRNAARP